MKRIKIFIERVAGAEDIPLPDYMTEGSSGMDLYASVDNEIVIQPGEIALVPTGIKVELPKNYEAQIRARSGMALKYGITVLNSPGTIDSDYRGEIKVILINLGKKEFTVYRKMRIAQIIISKIWKAEMIEVKALNNTIRGDGGFGHTGLVENIIEKKEGECEIK